MPKLNAISCCSLSRQIAERHENLQASVFVQQKHSLLPLLFGCRSAQRVRKGGTKNPDRPPPHKAGAGWVFEPPKAARQRVLAEGRKPCAGEPRASRRGPAGRITDLFGVVRSSGTPKSLLMSNQTFQVGPRLLLLAHGTSRFQHSPCGCV